ncbi:RHS repeat-associated core domain-containing protein [Nonomuraea wenchangensis]|uniref:RHS repeat-associated core domain-containing protein n=1 Tax=Nonomuraea wenchangensis TaxID=568860 RepID=A0A1I0KQZ7_9ACTN|nr:RHS repeat-associated core domain-containing protein [Nonomuraea wenchangensis]SEU27341.1 RHS repeat-associated core domain-containing protein [Nonomuraea wenchangensis]
MRVRRRLRTMVLAIATAMALVISGLGIPDNLVVPAAASVSGPDPETSVDGRPVTKTKVAKGAEESQPKVERKEPVWPSPGTAEVDPGEKAIAAGQLPVRLSEVKGTGAGPVKVETLPADTVRKLGGVGVAARLTADKAGKVRAEFSYASFRDAYGGNFATRLQLLRMPACALTTPRPRDCAVRPQQVKAHNDVKTGTLTADVDVDPATGKAASLTLPKSQTGKDATSNAAQAFTSGSVYVLAAGMTGPDGNFGATDLKPSGTWQAGTSGGGFSYDYPLPEAPSPVGNGPNLSLQYDASSVDGEGHWTNNQSGVVGLGWNLSAGFIERKYRRCTAWNEYDPNTADLIWYADENGPYGPAVCWESPDELATDVTKDYTQSELVLNLAGRSASIVKDRTSGLWKTVPDFGWKIEQLTGGADGLEYWKVTSSDGQVHRFGYNKDAQWQLQYIGNQRAEPCADRYFNDMIPPTCTGVWRWNLDQSIDANENVIDYTYERETNYFCMPGCDYETYKVLPYDRGGFLKQISYGHNTQVAGSTPTSRMTFTTSDRGGLDVPTDLNCGPTCATNDAVAFYSTRKLDSILTESKNPTSGAWEPDTRTDFRYRWIYTRTDFGPAYDPVLWLDSVQQTGLAGTSSQKLPPVSFDATMVAGRMDYDNWSDWTDFLSWRMVPRVTGIGNGMGGRIEVTYGQADPCGGGKGRDGTNYLSDATGDCYRVDYDANPEIGYESWGRFFKQLAMKVTERDLVGASPDMVTSYDYLGAPRWTNPVAFAQPDLAPVGSDWRGYSTVRTTRGSGSDPNGYTVTSDTFYRGIDGATITTFEGTTATDSRALQGQLLQEQTWKLTATEPRAYTEAESTRYEYQVVSTGTGPGVLDPAFVHRTRERTRELVTGGTWRWSDQRTAYNSDGQPTTVNDYGDTAVTTDNTCTSTTYARNPANGITSLPSTVEKRSGDSCTSGTLIGKTVALYDGGTDPATNTPSDGNITETRSYAAATSISVTKNTFDDYGRPLTATDPMGKVTTTTYTPAVGWPHQGAKVTNPLGHAVTTYSSHRNGLPTKVVDANNKTTEIDYDALGRTVTLWQPGQSRGGGVPTATVGYEIPFDGNLSQPTAAAKTTMRRLLRGTTYVSTYTYDDGFGRPRETQTASPIGGRIVVATTYDARGLTATTSQPTHNGAAPGSGLLNPALTALPSWTKTVYDSMERPTAVIDHHLAAELRRTTTAYPGLDRVEVTPPVGGKTATVTDVFDRTVKTEEWKDSSTHHDTTYTYNASGQLTNITDAKGNVRTFTYDWLGRRTAATDPDAGSSTYGYDAASRLLWGLDGKGAKVSNVYDDLGRRISQWAGEPQTGTKLAEWSFDSVAKGYLTSSTRFNGSQPYVDAVVAYDEFYQATETKLTIPQTEGPLAGEYTFTARYDGAGHLIEQRMPAKGDLAAETLTFGYTDLGMPHSLTSDYGGGATYVKESSYSATGRLNERSYNASAQIKRTFAWDEGTGWLSRMTTVSGSQLAQDDRVTYDTGGQITRIEDSVGGQSECFAYDGLDRLTAAFTMTSSSCTAGPDNQGTEPYSQSFAYDALGNLTSVTDDGITATYGYPAAGASAVRPNAVTSITRQGRTDSYGYDAAGRLTARTVDNKQSAFTWDALGQLDKVVTEGQETSMVYDAEGERLIRRDPDGSRTLYLGSMEVKATGAVVKATRYYSGPDGAVVAVRNGTGVTYMASGLHGTTQMAIDASTGQVTRERYKPYGQRRGIDDLPFTDRGFLGKVEDASTGLDYLSARYYDPSIGRFITTDPVLNLDKPQWINPYSYAASNPVGLSDPSGLRPITDARPADVCAQPKSVACKLKRKQQADADARAAQAEVDRQVKALLDSLLAIAKIAADELGITAGIKCFTSGDLGACGETALNILGSLAGGLAGKLAVKYSLPWKWKKAYELGKAIWKHAGDAISAFKNWLRAKDRLQAARSRARAAEDVLRKACSSFVPGTKVVMADNREKPIEEVKVGDQVIATDPVTGRTESVPVLALITSSGAKNLVRITVSDGDRDSTAGVLIATAEHPFWIDDARTWAQASQLRPGTWLRTSAGTRVQVTAIEKWTSGRQRVHNLTVAGPHTYHVAAGKTDILVHNDNNPTNHCGVDIGAAREQAVAELTGGHVSGAAGKQGMKVVRPGVGSTDVDVIGPNGEWIAVGGPAKAKNINKLRQKLSILKYAADAEGVRAIAYFEVGTPLSVIQAAMRILGAKNVVQFTR